MGIVQVNDTVRCMSGRIRYTLVPPQEYDPNNPSFDHNSRPGLGMNYTTLKGGSMSLTTLLKDTTVEGRNYPLPYLALSGVRTRTPVTIYSKSNCRGEIFARGTSFSKIGATRNELFGLSLVLNKGSYTFSAKVGKYCSNNLTFDVEEVRTFDEAYLELVRRDYLSGKLGKNK